MKIQKLFGCLLTVECDWNNLLTIRKGAHSLLYVRILIYRKFRITEIWIYELPTAINTTTVCQTYGILTGHSMAKVYENWKIFPSQTNWKALSGKKFASCIVQNFIVHSLTVSNLHATSKIFEKIIRILENKWKNIWHICVWYNFGFFTVTISILCVDLLIDFINCASS